MKPNVKWIERWRVGENQPRESQVSMGLLEIFYAFWSEEYLDNKSRTTIQRYSTSLLVLGGYLVSMANDYDIFEKTAHELLLCELTQYEGPLVYPDNNGWQDEFDMVCRKLFRYLNKTR